MELIIILPVHNEAKFLEQAVKEAIFWAEKVSRDYAIVIAEDGSTDGSDKLAVEMEKSIRNVKVVHNNFKLGRGKAVKNVMKLFEADVYAYIDADLATDMRFFPVLVTYIKNGYDVATGSRYVKGAVVHRPLLRLAVSRIYNWLIDALFKSEISDHQCGFKAFSRKFRDEALTELICDDWFWDAEVLILGRKKGLKIIEFPVYWVEKRSNRTSIKRLIKDIKIHSTELVKLWWKMRRNCLRKNFP